jgi:hypothetical protein
VEDLVLAARTELAHPERLSHARRRVASEMFFEPGTATARAVTLVRGLLDGDRNAHAVRDRVTPQPLGRGIS